MTYEEVQRNQVQDLQRDSRFSEQEAEKEAEEVHKHTAGKVLTCHNRESRLKGWDRTHP